MWVVTMAGLNIGYVVCAMFIVNAICYFLLGGLLMMALPKYFKRFSHANDATGKERYKLTILGSIAYLILQPLILWGVLSMEIGAENFA
jgi:hypothetical protein